MAKLLKVGTHLPVLKSLCDIFQPKTALELGTGTRSTPFLLSRVQHLVSVENDPRWHHEISKRYGKADNFRLYLHVVGNNWHAVPLKKYSRKAIARAESFYDSLRGEYPNYDLLFVDHFLGLRTMALSRLYSNFKFIAWHDEQNERYEFDKFFALDLGAYDRYRFCFWGCCTGFLIRKDQQFSEEELFASLDRYAHEYVALFKADLKKHSPPKWTVEKVG